MSQRNQAHEASIDPNPEQYPLASLVSKRIPLVNAGFNWDWVKQTFDPDPGGTALVITFVDKETGEPKESMAFTTEEGPRLDIIGVAKTSEDLGQQVPLQEYRFLGEIVTYRQIGFDVLDPDSKMTPWRARYQYDAVEIRPTEGESRERLWMVGSQILNVMLKATEDSDK